jgi:acyl-CoA dehydrogenase
LFHTQFPESGVSGVSSFIVSLFWLLLFVGGGIFLAYQRIDLRTSTIAAGLAVLAYTVFGEGSFLWKLVLWAAFGAMIVPNLIEFRREKITKPLLDVYRKMLPSMSDTEREALEAGNVWWEGELFSGMPNWDRLMSYPAPKLSDEEQAFLDGPCEELCRMLNDWEICHEHADMPREVWDYIIENKFFAMIIPKQYGGLEFSAYANACVIMKLASRSATASSTIGVPNSLGPAELLLHYGTEEQKNRYLPGLADGSEIPCFALTSPQAGSDAASIIDSGVVCKGEWEGKTIVGIRLNWDKRYITLAPIATVLGLAFKLYDPDHLIGDQDEYGITAALIPTDIPGVTFGRRHNPLTIGRPGYGGQRLEDAGRTAVRRPGNHLAVDRSGRRPGGQLCDRRLCHHSQAVQYVDRQLRRCRRGADPYCRLQLHHEFRRIRDVRCDRPGRKAGGAFGNTEVPLHRAGPKGQQRRDGRARW